MRDVLDTIERWAAQGLRFATATVVKTERSAPRAPGAVLAVSEQGEVAGSVTGGCVEPAVYDEAQDVLAGGPPRLVTYGIADEEAFDVEPIPIEETFGGVRVTCEKRCHDRAVLATQLRLRRLLGIGGGAEPEHVGSEQHGGMSTLRF